MHVNTMRWRQRQTDLRNVSEEELLVAAGRDLRMRPPLSSLRSIQLDDASWDEKKPFRGIMSVNDLPIVILYHTVQHIDVGSANDKQPGCTWTSV